MNINTIKLKYLSEKDLAAFTLDGFLIIRQMYGPRELQDLSVWIDEITARPEVPGEHMVYFEDSLLKKGEKIVSRIEKFSDYHDKLRQFILAEKMTGRVSELLGDAAMLFKEKVNFKMPGGGGFAPHQDIQPGWDDYAPYFVSVLVTVDKSTVENGCLELSAGHHTKGLLGEKWTPLTPEQLQGIEFKKCPMEPGDVAFFDCFVPHQSAPNLTSRRRRNLYLTYNRIGDGDFREKYFSDKRKSYPPDSEREPGREYKFKV